jgi:uncharacterized membrane-anchored protein YitT (DUF2179 family)
VWGEARRLLGVVLGSIIFAAGYALFFVPFKLAAGGLSGLGIVINHFTGWPVGTLYLVMNVPLLIVGFWLLGRWRFLVYTLVAIFAFSAATDLLVTFSALTTAKARLTNDMLLAAIYGGLVTGVGVGVVYRAGGTIGGTSILVRIIQQRLGAPVTQLYLLTDGLIVGAAGVVFGWNAALHALLGLFLGGIATDYVLEGPALVLTATIITNRPRELEEGLIEGLGRGTSHWPITGGYTGETRTLVLCTIYRNQLAQMKQIVADLDPGAFVVIGTAHQALGTGFLPLKGR